MEEKYTNEKIYKLFLEDCSEEYRSLLDEMLKEEKLHNAIMEIAQLEGKQLFTDAYYI